MSTLLYRSQYIEYKNKLFKSSSSIISQVKIMILYSNLKFSNNHVMWLSSSIFLIILLQYFIQFFRFYSLFKFTKLTLLSICSQPIPFIYNQDVSMRDEGQRPRKRDRRRTPGIEMKNMSILSLLGWPIYTGRSYLLLLSVFFFELISYVQ